MRAKVYILTVAIKKSVLITKSDYFLIGKNKAEIELKKENLTGVKPHHIHRCHPHSRREGYTGYVYQGWESLGPSLHSAYHT